MEEQDEALITILNALTKLGQNKHRNNGDSVLTTIVRFEDSKGRSLEIKKVKPPEREEL